MALEWEDWKDPDEVLDYKLDWAARLDPGDTISTSQWLEPVGSGAPMVQDSAEFTPTSTTIWLSGGELNATYDITNRVTTLGGRTMDQTVRLKCKAK